jgi:chromosome partitioning protein
MIIAAYNPKGGVGKTTTAVNVATLLARRGQSVLLVDLEADLNASISLGIRPTDAHPTIAELLLHEQRPADAIRPVDAVPRLHLIAGSTRLASMDLSLRHVRQPERRLPDIIRPLQASYDVIVLDSPAGYSLVSLSVPMVATDLIVPTRADYQSLESLAHFHRWYRDGRAAGQAASRVVGILMTMVDRRRQATREIVEIIRLHNRRGVFQTEIPQDPRVAEAPSHGIPLVAYARSRAAIAYETFTTELLRRLGGRRR